MSAPRELYERVMEVPDAQRAAWIAAHCADASLRVRLAALLDAQTDAAHDVLTRPAAERLAQLAPDADSFVGADAWIGKRVGAFRLQKLIGEGGMAAVFLAAREGADFDQHVAIKLLRRGVFSSIEQRLFRRERQTLAALAHPHIARLIDGGIAEAGVPFLAMEYVDGVPLTDYCSRRGAGVRERIALIATACRAVDAAHRALIVHRDLKPSNILVDTAGAVKLLDFGIAKLLDDDAEAITRTGFGALTPEYAAPEQFAGGPITTATDVFALGVLLHELLLGERPDGAPPMRPSSRVVQLDATRLPAPPPTLRGMLRGDLDNVILKALEPEPARRYASAGALADDLERYVEGRPVAAHPPSAWYRTRKFVQRHRGGVALTVLLMLGMLAGVAAALWQGRIARQEALRAGAVRDFLIEALDASKSEVVRDQRPGLDELLKAARERIDTDTRLDAVTRAELLHTLGEIALSGGNYTDAKALLARAIESRTAAAAPELAESQVRLAQVLLANREFDAARQLVASVMPRVERMTNQVAVEAWLTQGNALLETGDVAHGIEAAQRGAALAAKVYGPGARETLASEMLVGDALAKANRKAEAAQVLAPAIARWRAAGFRADNKLAISMSNLAMAKSEVGDNAGAIALLEEVIALRRRIFNGPHDAIALALGNLGSIYLEQGDLARATELYEQALAMRRELFGNEHPALVPTLANLGNIARKRRDYAAAQRWYRDGLRISEASGTVKTSAYPTVMHNLAYTQMLAGDAEAAEQTEQRALAIYRELFGPKHNSTGTALALLAQIAVERRAPAVALERIDEALAILEADQNSAPQSLLLGRFTRVQALYGVERTADAAALLDTVIADWRRTQKSGQDRLLTMLAQRARIELRNGDRDAARRSAAEALALGVDRAAVRPATLEFLEATANL